MWSFNNLMLKYVIENQCEEKKQGLLSHALAFMELHYVMGRFKWKCKTCRPTRGGQQPVKWLLGGSLENLSHWAPQMNQWIMVDRRWGGTVVKQPYQWCLCDDAGSRAPVTCTMLVIVHRTQYEKDPILLVASVATGRDRIAFSQYNDPEQLF